jgi:lipopolysaccharide/colanic/teichoic acid biosynthesis glycosyltransferase
MYTFFLKRTLDILLTSIVFILVFPILLTVSVILLFTGEHQVIYFQERIGRGLKPFYIWKFTTMLKNSENLGNGLFTVREDPRVLPFGKLLRKTKINEIPQLINILIGDMSIVGPRPLVYNPYKNGVGERVFNSRPGLTGIGSIVFRDEELLLSKTSMDKKEFLDNHISPFKGELELWYQSKKSFQVDMKIIFLTLWVVFFPKSGIIERWFTNLPNMPDSIKNLT